jgi:hypothetical protein
MITPMCDLPTILDVLFEKSTFAQALSSTMPQSPANFTISTLKDSVVLEKNIDGRPHLRFDGGILDFVKVGVTFISLPS